MTQFKAGDANTRRQGQKGYLASLKGKVRMHRQSIENYEVWIRDGGLEEQKGLEWIAREEGDIDVLMLKIATIERALR